MRDWLERISLDQAGPRCPWGSLKQVQGAREQGCPLGQHLRLVGTLGLGAMREHPPAVPETLCHPAQTASGVLLAFLSISYRHKIKRRLLLGRKVMTNLDSIFKSRDITVPTKVHLVKAMVFPVVMYGYDKIGRAHV